MSSRKESETPALPSLQAWGAQQDEAKYEENAKIARTARTARKIAAEREQEAEKLRKALGLYENVLEGFAKRKETPAWLSPPRADRHMAIPSLLVTDVHFDEQVREDEIEGYNKYNRPIGLMRIQRAFTKALMLCQNYFAGVDYSGFQLFLGGDLLSGIIHEELTETNAAQLCESIMAILDPLEQGIRLLGENFPAINITGVVGNHGRRTKKPRSKFRAKDNFDWLVYSLLAKAIRDQKNRFKNVTFDVSTSADATATLYSTRYRLTHGDQFKGGSGIAAELSPLFIGSHRKSKRQSAIGKPYDVLVMGHWHQTLWLPSKGIIMGGSVVGYNEHAYMSNFSPEPPQCSLWLTTPEHGITMCAPVFVQDRTAEGW